MNVILFSTFPFQTLRRFVFSLRPIVLRPTVRLRHKFQSLLALVVVVAVVAAVAVVVVVVMTVM